MNNSKKSILQIAYDWLLSICSTNSPDIYMGNDEAEREGQEEQQLPIKKEKYI